MTRRLSLIMALASLACVLIAGSAAGSAFYNKSESGQPNPIDLYFSCGVFCDNSWTIPVGQGEARPGLGGSFWILDDPAYTGHPSGTCDTGNGHPDVQAHGWAELHYLSQKYVWEMWGTDKNPIAGSPFALDLGTRDPVPPYECDASKRPAGSSAHGSKPAATVVACKSLAASTRADFKKLDLNHDGFIEASEAQKAMTADFRAMDLDHDGVITLHDIQLEFNRTGGGRATGPLSRYLPYDSKDNGKITLSEYLAQLRKHMFLPMDTNHDGKISLAEAIAFAEKPFKCK